MKYLKFLARSFALFLLSVHSAVAEMMINDPENLISRDEVEAVVTASECCNSDFWYLAALEYEYSGLSAENYKFRLSDGNILYLIIQGIGPHTYHYLGFLDGVDFTKPKLLTFESPEVGLDMGELTVKKDRPLDELIANPSFDAKTQELLSWDFMGSGERSYGFVYLYDKNVAEFTLKKFHQNINMSDGTQVDVNVQF
mgnify:CR=1 FL=1